MAFKENQSSDNKMTGGVAAFASAMNDVLSQLGVDPFDVFGCTNYMDVRLFNIIDKYRAKLSADQKRLLASGLTAFLRDIEGDGSYFLQGCGTYELKVPAAILDQIAEALVK